MRNKTFKKYNKIKLFRNNIEHSVFYVCAKSDKKYKPVDVDGIRYKLNLETGELDYYKKKEIETTNLRSVDRSYGLLRELLEMNDFDWFITLTFDNGRVKRTDNEEIYKAYMQFIKNIARKFPIMRYVTVPELHEKYYSLHFHMLVGGIKPAELGFVDSGKVCCSWATKKNGVASLEYFSRTKSGRELTPTDGLPIYNVTKFEYGFSTASRIASRERCNWYIQKYLDKALGSTALFKKRFFYSSNLNRKAEIVKILLSKYPENVKNTVSKSLEKLLSENVFYNSEYNFLKFVMTRENFDKYNEAIFADDQNLIDIDGELIFEEEYEYGKY